MSLATRERTVTTYETGRSTNRYGGPDTRILGKVEIDRLLHEFNGAGIERQRQILADLTAIVDPKTRDDALSDLCRCTSDFDAQIPVILEAMGKILDRLEASSLIAMIASRHTDRPTQETAMRILIQRKCLNDLVNVAFIARDIGVALWAVHELGEQRDVVRLGRIFGAPFMHGDKDVEEAVLAKTRELLRDIEGK